MSSKTLKQAETVAGKTLIKLKESERARMILLFRNLHFIAKHNLSFKIYKTICELDKSKGLDVGTTYINDKACALFIKNIATTEHIQTKQIFKDSPFVSITSDGTSDYTGEEYESLFLKASVQGEVTERFVNVGKKSWSN